jgi:hypothetical protein
MFKEIKTKDDKKFDGFYDQINEIFNFRLNVGEKIVDNKIFQKNLEVSIGEV